MNCPSCSSVENMAVLTVEKAPLSCARLFSSREDAARSGECRLEIVQCAECSHVWNQAHEEGLDSIYGSDYYSSFTKSAKAQESQSALAESVDQLIKVASKTVLEIGCGDGFFLGCLSGLGAKTIGFEPSSTYHTAKNQPGVEVVNDFFRFEDPPGLRPAVDVVVMRHVLEHLACPSDVLSSLRTARFEGLSPEYLVLEVPNVSQLFRDDLYFDFYNDHVHYFSYPSLERCVRSAGWVPLSRLECEDEFLVLVCANGDRVPDADVAGREEASSQERDDVVSAGADFREKFEHWKAELTGIVATQRKKDKGIAVWGAGARGVALLTGLGLPPDSFSYVVDSDSNKHERYLPVVQLPVFPVDHLEKEAVDYVLVTSYTYFDEISSQLEWFRDAGGKIIRIYPNPQVVG